MFTKLVFLTAMRWHELLVLSQSANISYVCVMATNQPHRPGPASICSLRASVSEPATSVAQDVFKTQKQIEAAGGKIVREAGAIPGLGTKIVRPVAISSALALSPSCAAVSYAHSLAPNVEICSSHPTSHCSAIDVKLYSIPRRILRLTR